MYNEVKFFADNTSKNVAAVLTNGSSIPLIVTCAP